MSRAIFMFFFRRGKKPRLSRFPKLKYFREKSLHVQMTRMFFTHREENHGPCISTMAVATHGRSHTYKYLYGLENPAQLCPKKVSKCNIYMTKKACLSTASRGVGSWHICPCNKSSVSRNQRDKSASGGRAESTRRYEFFPRFFFTI